MMFLEDSSFRSGVHYGFETKKTLIGFRLKVTIESESETQSYCIFVEVAKYQTVGQLSREICRRFGMTNYGNVKIFLDKFEVPSEELVLVLAGVELVRIQLTRRPNDGFTSVDYERRQRNSQRSENSTKRSKRHQTEEELYPNRGLAQFIDQLRGKNRNVVSDERVERENTIHGARKMSHCAQSLADFYEQLRNESEEETSGDHVENTKQNNTMECDPQSDISGPKLVYDPTSPTYAPETVVAFEEEGELGEVRRKRRRRHKKKKENAAVDEVDRAQVRPDVQEYPRPSGTGKHIYFKDFEEPQDLDPTNVYGMNVNGIREYPSPSETGKPSKDFEVSQDLDPTKVYRRDVKEKRELSPSNGLEKHTQSKDSEATQDLDPTEVYRRNVNGIREYQPSNGLGRHTHSKDFEAPQDLDPTNVYRINVNGTVPGSKIISSHCGRNSEESSKNDSENSTNITRNSLTMNDSFPVPQPRNHLETDKQLGTLLMYKDLKTCGRYNVQFVNNHDADNISRYDNETQSTSATSSRNSINPTPSHPTSVVKRNSYAVKVKDESGTEDDCIKNKKPKFADEFAETKSSDCSMVCQSRIGKDGIYFRFSNTEWKVLTEELAARNLPRVTKPKESQTIVFQLLFLNHINQPELSQLILGRVFKFFSAENKVVMEINSSLLDRILKRDEDGELMLPEGMNAISSQVYELNWDAVNNPRLLG